MKSLKRRFNNISEKNPLWSSYTNFAEAITSQHFSRSIIHRWFQKLVDKNDYARNEKRAILEHLENLTDLPRTTENKTKRHR
ncbi:MAG: hypothetical protein EOM84_00515 [Sphingobacteriia bacterium]|jgi:hypothetical protein|nr:hypothetical protein [Sphingobacteriia bacterium]